ncbi:DUF2279 domain-containing protein [Agriterribacter sp.]|uniref:DUF2279 domain-containing protein n=1 Tax=Agriterribacter sp. TaxID=2821509 RepID=UPI002B600106|nr:DUF2279 domain-containing protein [Agriterribacter sp.]HRO47091.1 DUF2279 domain-containing protein [Agriterribacter sp.]HRQ19540.1 DUF2279 domain-containing protein [Agriterribacter sp.]
MHRFNRIISKTSLFVVLCLGIEPAHAQHFLPPSDTYRPDRLKKVVITEVAVSTAVSVGLYYLWYKKFPRSRFHLFNDNREWLQMDKAGHAVTAYNIGVLQYDMMRWCGVKKNDAIIIGSATALGGLTVIEILDGFSTHWGFSKGDMLANLVGTAIFASQQRWWNEQRVTMKFSAHFSPYAQYHRGELGKSWASRILKDYNGQSYWLSFNVKSFLPASSAFPNWPSVALGYGADGMIGGHSNPDTVKGNLVPQFERTRRFMLSPDADLFRVRSIAPVDAATYLLKPFKFPAPTLEINSKGKFRFYGLYH